MEFICQTTYDQKALTAISRALRKTIRAKNSRRMRILSWIAVVMELVCLVLSLRLPWLAACNGLALILLLLLLWKEDAVNAFFAWKKQLPGTERRRAVFQADGYTFRISGAVTRYPYSRVLMLAEDAAYVILILGKNHAQAFDKRNLSGGSAEDFRRFLEEKTGKAVQRVGQ